MHVLVDAVDSLEVLVLLPECGVLPPEQGQLVFLPGDGLLELEFEAGQFDHFLLETGDGPGHLFDQLVLV